MPYRKRGEKRVKREVETDCISLDNDTSVDSILENSFEIKVEEDFSDEDYHPTEEVPSRNALCIRPERKKQAKANKQASKQQGDKSADPPRKRGRPPLNRDVQQLLARDGEPQIRRKYNCKNCTRTFTSKNSYLSHERSHATKQKLYECEVCKRTYKCLSFLKTHFRTHSKERPFQCDICFKSFLQGPHLMKHRFIHTGLRPWECDVCKKCFKYPQDLKRHSMIHTGERPYVCTVCNKAFNQSTSLQVHERIHTGEKPYQCTICDRSFRERGTLSKHERRHTGERDDEEYSMIFLGPSDINFDAVRRPKPKMERIFD